MTYLSPVPQAGEGSFVPHAEEGSLVPQAVPQAEDGSFVPQADDGSFVPHADAKNSFADIFVSSYLSFFRIYLIFIT